MRVADRGEQLVLGLGIEVDECDRLRWRGRPRPPTSDSTSSAVRSRVVAEVVAPADAALGDVDPPQEAGDHLAQLVQHQLAVVACLGQRVGAQTQQQRLERLTAAIDADVGQRRRRQDAAHGVERLGPRRLAVHELAVVGVALDGGAHVIGDRAEHRL